MSVKMFLLFVVGCVGLVLGAIGAVVPLLPAFPFLGLVGDVFLSTRFTFPTNPVMRSRLIVDQRRLWQ